MNRNLQAIILAAGKSTRFNTKQSKLIEKICGQEMILYPTKLLASLEISTTLVVGYQREILESVVRKNHGERIKFVHQKEQIGTGHALLCTQDLWDKKNILILNGDVPLITTDMVTNIYQKHMKENAQITFVTAHNIDPTPNAYGRVIQENDKIKIVEAKDDKEERREHCCINAGIYLINKEFLQRAIHDLQKSSVTGELYITDLINIASQKGLKVETLSVPFDLIRGINTLQELWAVEQIKRSELIKYWMDKGIRFWSAQNNHIDLNVTIGAGTQIEAGVQLYGSTKIGENCKIEAFSILQDATLENNVTILPHSIIKESTIQDNAKVGPFAHVHSNSIIGQQAHIGNFVDVKKSDIGQNSKIKHLAYIGDSLVGKDVNIGAGTITCNFNGLTKEKTVIEDNAYIGSNNSLIAPIKIGKDAFTAAGSVITKDVPENALAIARAHQVNKEEYAKKLKQPAFFASKKINNSISNPNL